MAKLLLVEDDGAIAEPITDFLRFDGHSVEHVEDGAEAILRLRISNFDCIILDWNLPNVPGIDVLREYRGRGGQTPVLMLTAKNLVTEKILGLEHGADDYLTKPFDARELNSRVRALLRRPAQSVGSILIASGLKVDTSSKSCFLNGARLNLLAKEYAVLEFLLLRKGKPFTAEQILKNVWASDTESGSDAVRQCLARLKRKVNADAEKPILVTMIGLGYKIDEHDEENSK